MRVTELDVRKPDHPRNTRRWGYSSNGRYYRNRADSDIPTGKGRVYLSVHNESLLENFGNRTSRPHAKLKPVVVEALTAAGLNVEGMRWSKNAGCTMCPCSPGWVLPNERGTDAWVTVDMQDEPAATNPDESASRQVQLLAQF